MSSIDQHQSISTDRFTRSEIHSLLTLASVYMARMLGLFMILPVFAIYAQDMGNVSPLLAGVAIGIYGLAQASLQIPLGALSDRIGRKAVILGGLCLFIVGSVVAALSDNIYWLILGRFLQGSGAIASAIMALVSDVTREQLRTKAMAIIGASIGMAFLLAMLLGPLLYPIIGMQGIFLFTAVLASLAFVLVFFCISDSTQQISPVLPVEKVSFYDLFRNKQLQTLNIGVFVLHWVLTSSFLVLPLLLVNEYGLDITRHAGLYLLVFVAAFIIMWPLLKFFDRSSARFSILMIALLVGVQLFLGLTEVKFMLFVASLVLFFVAFNSLEASMPSLLSRLVHPARKGAAMGIYSSSQFIGAFAGGVIGGAVYQGYGWQALFLLNVCLCITWMIISIYHAKK